MTRRCLNLWGTKWVSFENSCKHKLKYILDDITSKIYRLEGKFRKEVLHESLTHSQCIRNSLRRHASLVNILTAFTIASADNINFLHSLGRVYSGNQKLNWQQQYYVYSQPSVFTDSSRHITSWTAKPPTNSQLVHTARVSSYKKSANVRSFSSLLWFNKQPQSPKKPQSHSSNVAYLCVTDQRVDNKPTLFEIIDHLHEDFI